jgi:RND family efflux transporter MFP subunit
MAESNVSLLAREASRASAESVAPTEVRLPPSRWKTRVLLPGALLLITVALVAVAAGDALWPATTVRVVPAIVKTDVEAQPAGSVVVQAPGWVEADPFPIGVSALADGVVEEMLVLEGARIKRGEVVARLVADDARIALSRADAVLAERRAALASARAILEEAQRNWEYPIELTRKLDTARAQLAEKRAELDRWPAELAREQAHAVYLKAEYERTVPLREKGQASDIELTKARQADEAQSAEVEATRRREPILKAQITALEAEVQAATDDLRLRIGDTRALAAARAAVQRAEADVATAEARREEAVLRMTRMEVRSPADGVVMTRLVEPGSKLMLKSDNPRSAQVVRLYDPAKLQVRVDIPLVEAAGVGVGQPAEVIVDVLPDRVFDGHVTRVVHEADVQKNTLQVKVAIANPSPEIKPEMLARARFLSVPDPEVNEAEASAQRLFVPESAVHQREGQTFVWLADQVDKVARLTPVTVGRAMLDGWLSVSDGLSAGDRVIVDAPPGLAEGGRIRLLEE